MTIQHLIAEAVALGGGNLCASGHDWWSDGGRQCPRNPHSSCSQPVYQCARCGAYDYGEPGGPGHDECMVRGPCSMSCSGSGGGKPG